MSAADSSSSRPEAPVIVSATISFDGVLLACSEDVESLTDLIERPFERLDLTLHPSLVGSDFAPTLLPQSHRLILIDRRQDGDMLVLTYRK